MSSTIHPTVQVAATIGPTTLHTQVIAPPPGLGLGFGMEEDAGDEYDPVTTQPTKKTITMRNPAWTKNQVYNVFDDREMEPRFLHTPYFPTTAKNGHLIRDATTGGFVSNDHRVGTAHEAQLFKVRVMTGKHNGLLYYNSPGEFEREFFHNRKSVPSNLHQKWENNKHDFEKKHAFQQYVW